MRRPGTDHRRPRAQPWPKGEEFSDRELVVLTAEGSGSGPVLCVTGGVHGDEVTPVEVIHRFRESLDQHRFVGRVVLVPSVNPDGLRRACRQVPSSGEDLNRCFPGDPAGSLGDRIAHRLFSAIEAHRPELVVDLHTDSVASLPYVILDRAISKRAVPALRRATELAAGSNLPIISDWPLKEYRHHRLDRSLSGALLNHLGCPSFTVELGPTRVVDPSFVAVGLEVLATVMQSLGMIASRVMPASAAYRGPRLDGAHHRVPGISARYAGLVRYAVGPGDEVRKGDRLATIVDLRGTALESICAPLDGRVLSLAERAVSHPGAALITLAAPDHSAETGKGR